jgi:TPR repeat protein
MKTPNKIIALKYRMLLLTLSLILASAPLATAALQSQQDLEERVLALTMQDMTVLHQKAVSGDATAQYMLGRAFHLGWAFAKDLSKAADWYLKAAQQGFAPAQLMMFEMYSEGVGVQKDPAAALKWLQKAVERGFAPAQFTLGLYVEGAGNYSEAAKLYRKAAEQGLARAQTATGFMYEQGNGVQKDFKQAVNWYRKAAEQGDATAQSNLGNMLYLAKGTNKDSTEAAKWFLKSAEQGWAEGQLNLAGLYLVGEGVTKDLISAYMWLSIAATSGNDTAKQTMRLIGSEMKKEDVIEAERRAIEWTKSHASLATYKRAGNTLYVQSQSIPNELTTAIKEYQAAAERGDAQAQSQLGELYYRAKEYKEAIAWFRKSADQGYVYGQYNLGVAYLEGSGVPKDYSEAIKWFIKAAEQWLPSAMNNLAALYYTGQGVAKDLVAACMWFSLTAASGDELAKQNLEVLKEQLTPAEIKEAIRREAAWRVQHPKRPQQ